MQRRGWWRAALVVQWVAAAAAVIGLSLLLLRELLTSAELPALVAGPEPVWLAVGGLAAGVLLALVARPLVYRSADQARQQAAEQLRVVLGAVGQEYVIEPVRAVLQAYEQTREAFARTAR